MLKSRTFGSVHCRRLLVVVVVVNLLGVWNFGRVVVRDDVVVMFDCGVGDGATKGRRRRGGGDFGVVRWEAR